MERSAKSLVLIRAKHLAESVTTPMFLADATGQLIFYNEAAEVMMGKPFSDVGVMSTTEWRETFNIRNRDGTPFPLEQMPGWTELQGERPSVGHFWLTAFDGTDHFLALCAFPLFTSQRQFDGALVLFWEESD